MNKIDLNTSKDLYALKESINKVIDKSIADKEIDEAMNRSDALSFCESKTLFESVLDKLYDNQHGRKLISSYVKLMKENKSLNKAYKIVENVSKKVSDEPVLSAYIISEVCSSIDKKALLEGENRMRKLCTSAVKLSNSNLNDINNTLNECKVLSESVDYLFKNKKSLNNMDTYMEKVNTLANIIKENKGDVSSNMNESIDNGDLMSGLSDLMNNDLNLWENRVVKDIALCTMSNGNKSDLFESYLSDCVATIDNMLVESDDMDKNCRLQSMKVQLLEKKYNQDTFMDDLFKLSELKETLEND